MSFFKCKSLLIVLTAAACLSHCKTSSSKQSNASLEQSGSRNLRKFDKITCTGGRNGLTMTLIMSENELAKPTFHILREIGGERVSYIENAVVVEDSNEQFVVEKNTNIEDRQNIQVSAVVEWKGATGKGFYQEAANGGMSPLPPSEFKTCTPSLSASSDSSTRSTSPEACKIYIQSCSNGKKPVDCQNSNYCIDEIPGANYPQCVPTAKLVSSRGTKCGTTAPCKKCP